jgi:hypothetical protein
VEKEEIQAQAKRPRTNIDEKHRLTGRKVQRWCGLPSSSHHRPWRLHCNNGDLDFRVKKGRWLERLREKGEKIETKKEYNVLICYRNSSRLTVYEFLLNTVDLNGSQ